MAIRVRSRKTKLYGYSSGFIGIHRNSWGFIGIFRKEAKPSADEKDIQKHIFLHISRAVVRRLPGKQNFMGIYGYLSGFMGVSGGKVGVKCPSIPFRLRRMPMFFGAQKCWYPGCLGSAMGVPSGPSRVMAVSPRRSLTTPMRVGEAGRADMVWRALSGAVNSSS